MATSRWHIYWRGKNSRAIRGTCRGLRGKNSIAKKVINSRGDTIKFTMVKVQAHFHHNRDGIYIGEGIIPELLGVHIVGYDGRIPSLKGLLIRKVIYSRILSHLPLRWLPSCDLLDKEALSTADYHCHMHCTLGYGTVLMVLQAKIS